MAKVLVLGDAEERVGDRVAGEVPGGTCLLADGSAPTALVQADQ